MFNVAILKMKDILKYLLAISIIISILIGLPKIKFLVEKIKLGSMKQCLEETITVISTVYETNVDIAEDNQENTNVIDKKLKDIEKSKYLEHMLKSEISSMSIINGYDNEKKQINSAESNTNSSKEEKDNQDKENNSINENLTLAETENVDTEVVTENALVESFNNQYGDVKIKNQTSYELTEDILTPDIKIDNKNILLFHTHTCESYTPSEKYNYVQTGNFRTTDLDYTVARVGTELEKYLNKYNLNVIHDTTYHDYPSYNGSYTNSLATVEQILENNPTDIIIDLHRDAIGSRPDYAPIVKIGEDYAAQIMFVIGTNEGGLLHPNWQQNLKFAIKVQQKAEDMYPGLFKPILLTKSRYNQHTGKYASIIEVGATGNTLEQTLISMKYLSAVLNEILK